MEYPYLYDPTIMSDKPVDDTTIGLATSFLSGMNMKILDGGHLLMTHISTIKWLKTGSELQQKDVTFLDTNVSELQEDDLFLAIWFSTWICKIRGATSFYLGNGTRYDEIAILEGSDLENLCRSDNPQWCHSDYCMIKDTSGTFVEIGLPEEGYERYTEEVLEDFYYYDLFDNVDMEDRDSYNRAHPTIRKYLDRRYKLYLDNDRKEQY